MTLTRPALAAAGAVLLATFLAGCSAGDTDTTDRNSAGEVVSGGDVGVSKLQVGDCVTKAALGESAEASPSASPEVSEVESLPAVPCTEPHGGEVVLVDAQQFADATEMPDQKAMFDQAEAACIPAIKAYTGFDFDAYLEAAAAGNAPDVDVRYAPFTLIPTQDSWAAGDRSMVCIAATMDAGFETIEETTGSAKTKD